MSESRFLIIDGVQVSRARAERLGLIKKSKSKQGPIDGPPNSRARTPDSARLAGQENLKPDDDSEAAEAADVAAAAAEAADDAAEEAEVAGTPEAAATAAGAAAEAAEDADVAAKATATATPKPAPKKK